MNKQNIKISKLQQYVNKLNTISGQFKLYIYLCHKESEPDVKRLNAKIEEIRQIVINIENEISRF